MYWPAAARRLLQNWTCSKSTTPLIIELYNLSIVLRPCDGDRLLGLENIGVIRNAFSDPNLRIEQQLSLLSVACQPSDPIEYRSRYSSSLLSSLVYTLNEHSTRDLRAKRYDQYTADCLLILTCDLNCRGRIRVKHDTCSTGNHLDTCLVIPDSDGNIVQYVAIITRQRNQPEALPSTTELYSLLSLAARFSKQETHASVVKVSHIKACLVTANR